jgi:Fe-S-cluster containining protein
MTQKSPGSIARWSRSRGDVPCGDCHRCCTGHAFEQIGLEPFEVARFPQAIWHEETQEHAIPWTDGRCPFFIDGRCSIYEHRPSTCRVFDCRIYLVQTVPVYKAQMPLIADVLDMWDDWRIETVEDVDTALAFASAKEYPELARHTGSMARSMLGLREAKRRARQHMKDWRDLVTRTIAKHKQFVRPKLQLSAKGDKVD